MEIEQDIRLNSLKTLISNVFNNISLDDVFKGEDTAFLTERLHRVLCTNIVNDMNADFNGVWRDFNLQKKFQRLDMEKRSSKAICLKRDRRDMQNLLKHRYLSKVKNALKDYHMQQIDGINMVKQKCLNSHKAFEDLQCEIRRRK